MRTSFPYRAAKALITTLILLFFTCSIGLTQNADKTECPYFTVFCKDTNGVAFSLISTDVDATVAGVIANVTVEQTYYNAGDSVVDATYVFPMSTHAAIYGMQMIVNNRTIEAVIKRKAEAQEIYENADSSGLTATLLEQERPNVFQMSLANIRAGDSVRVRMVYTEVLVPAEGVYQFVFPTIVGSRYTTNGEPWVSQTVRDSLAVAQTRLGMKLKINAGMPLLAECKSHAVTFAYEGNSAQTEIVTNPGDDFIVDYTLDGNQIETGLLLYEGEEENFFLSMIQPAKPDVTFESPSREYVFIMDISGSMSGEPLEVSKALISNLLTDLDFDDKFNIVFFAGSSAVLSENSIPATIDNINMALDVIDNVAAGGGTQILPAMQRALDMEIEEEYVRSFVILTDGKVTVEKEAFDLIRQNLHEANFFAFGIGTTVNRFIIEGIAYVGEGEPFIATDQVDAYDLAARFKEYIERPVLMNIQVAFSGIDVYDVEPPLIPDMFAERPILVYGKYHKPALGYTSIKGDYAGGTASGVLDFSDYSANADENIALQYLWARKRIKLMSDYGIASNESDTIPIEEEITRLGLKYHLITEYTSFVAVDSNAVATANPDPSGEGGDVGGPTEFEDLFPFSGSAEKGYIRMMGSVIRPGGVVRLKLENLEARKYHDLSLQVTDMYGHVLLHRSLLPYEAEEIISFSLGSLPPGVFMVSLFSEYNVLDTERFVMLW